MTSSEQQFTIPKGVDFKATQKPQFNTLTDFKATEDLMVLSKGSYLELEQEANAKMIKKSREAKKQGTIVGIIGSILTILAGLVGKGLIKKRVS